MNTSQLACFLTVAETTMEELRGERLIVGEPWSCPEQLRGVQYAMIEDKSALDVYLCDSG